MPVDLPIKYTTETGEERSAVLDAAMKDPKAKREISAFGLKAFVTGTVIGGGAVGLTWLLWPKKRRAT